MNEMGGGTLFGGIIIWVCVLINVIVAQYTPSDNILLNCGATDKQTTDSDGRKWSSDIGSKFLSSAKGSSTASAGTQAPDVGEVPFMSARLFDSNFTYQIAVAPGRKFVRLYFYPNVYSGRNSSCYLCCYCWSLHFVKQL